MDGTLVAALVLGFILGIEHALEADHVVAVTTLVGRTRNLFRAALMGIVWGLGHTTTLFIVAGLIMVLLRVAIPQAIALSLEFAVGVMLVTLGIVVLRGWLLERKHEHVHGHDALEHEHGHGHHVGAEHSHAHGLRRPYLIGLVHGMAGSAVLFLLVLSQIESTVGALVYIAVFGFGSVLSMMLVTTAISIPFLVSAERFQNLNSMIRVAAGSLSIFLGLVVMYQVGFVQGLFTSF